MKKNYEKKNKLKSLSDICMNKILKNESKFSTFSSQKINCQTTRELQNFFSERFSIDGEILFKFMSEYREKVEIKELFIDDDLFPKLIEKIPKIEKLIILFDLNLTKQSLGSVSKLANLKRIVLDIELEDEDFKELILNLPCEMESLNFTKCSQIEENSYSNISRFKNLKKLKLCSIGKISEDSCRQISKSCSDSLLYLYIPDAEGIRDRHLSHFAENCQNLTNSNFIFIF